MTTQGLTPQNGGGKGLSKVLFPIVAIIAVSVAALLFLRWQHSQKPVQNTETTGSGAVAEMRVGAVLPDFQLHSFKTDSNVAISSLQSKVKLINFWATWCEACMVEMPSIVKLHDAYKARGLDVVAIDLDTNPDSVLPHTIQKYAMGFGVYTDTESKLADLFQIEAIPLSVVIDSNRKILLIENEGLDWNGSDFRAALEKWLAG